MTPRTTYREVLGSVIAQRRRACGLSQLEVAEVLGFAGASNWSKIERGVYPLAVDQLEIVAQQCLHTRAADVLADVDRSCQALTERGVEVLFGAPPRASDGASVAIGFAALGLIVGAAIGAVAASSTNE